MAGIPVRVELTFVLTAVLLGMYEPKTLPVWVGVVFVSLLVHELGHAFAFRAFGHSPRIVLQAFGGHTSSATRRPLSPGRNLAVSLAGPFAGFALGGAAYLVWVAFGPFQGVAATAADRLVWVSVVWGVFNLLPVLPLDGGQSLAAFLDIVTKGRGLRPALVVSTAVGVAAALAAAVYDQPFAMLFMGMFAFRSVTQLVQLRAADREAPHRTKLVAASTALERGDADAAVAAAVDVVAAGDASDALRAQAARIAVEAHLTAERPDDADRALRLFPDSVPAPVSLRAAVLEARGEPAAALRLIEQAYLGAPSDPTAAEYASALAARGRFDDSVAILNGAWAGAAGPITAWVVVTALHDAGRYDDAAKAGETAWQRARSPVVASTIASSLAAAGRDDEAIAWLRQAVDLGYDDGDALDRSTAFARLRPDPRFATLRRRLG